MGEHLKVDLGLLRATGAGLGQIRDALQRAEAAKVGVEVLGSGELAGAMDEFVDNWKIHRGRLVSSIEAHQKMAVESAEAYANTDTELAKELTTHGSAGGAAPLGRGRCGESAAGGLVAVGWFGFRFLGMSMRLSGRPGRWLTWLRRSIGRPPICVSSPPPRGGMLRRGALSPSPLRSCRVSWARPRVGTAPPPAP